MPDRRQIIRERAAARGLSYPALSIMAGQEDGFVGSYVEHGTPSRLGEDERRLLAMVLDVDETQLGARMPWLPATGGNA